MCNCCSCRVERLCSASFPEKHFLYRVGKADILYIINQADVIAFSCSLLSPKKSYKQRLLMRLDPKMVNTLDLALILDFQTCRMILNFKQLKRKTLKQQNNSSLVQKPYILS